MPYVVNINIDTLPEMKYFSDSGYDIKVFESLIDDVIIRSYTTSDVYTFHRHTLPVKNLNEYFSLSCLQGVKINNYLCDKYVNKFLDVLYLYDLNSVSDQLPEIYRYLDENQQQRFCE